MISREKADVLGAVLACSVYGNVILIFVARLLKKPVLESGLGLALMVAAIPLAFLLIVAPSHRRPVLYYVQAALMLSYLIVEFLLDYVFKTNFRSQSGMVVGYVMLFFAGTGGLLGIASHAGRARALPAIGLYIIMAAMAFVQRAITGL